MSNSTTRAAAHVARTNERKRERVPLSEFVQRKREMFLIQYSLSVKRDEMRKLDEKAQKREEALRRAEKMLDEDASRFDEFLKNNNIKTMEATKRAEAETKAKNDKIAEIKKLNTQIATIKSEMAKYDEQLEDCRKYKEFLDRLTPPEKRPTLKAGELANPNKADDEEEMYFKDPQQLLDIFKELEQNNMFLIQNSQEAEKVLEDLKAKFKETKERMENETSGLRAQIASLQAAIRREEEKARMLEERAKKNIGTGVEEQEQQLDALKAKVEEVYKTCLGDNDANLNVLQMLTKIEGRMEELFRRLEELPKEYVQAAEKKKDEERRQQLREEKKEKQRQAQEERIRRALARAQAPVKKRTGKPVMFRSTLIKKQKDYSKERAQKNDEEEEFRYFFVE